MGFLKKFGSLFGSKGRRADSKRKPEQTVEDLWPNIEREFDANLQAKDDRATVSESEWYPVISSNVDRIRWGPGDSLLQVIFKDGSLYQYWDVERETFVAFLGTHSPGGFVWAILRQYGYRYAKLGTGHATAPPAAPRFDEQPFAVPKDIEALQAAKGRQAAQGGLWNWGTPTAKGAVKPPAGAGKTV